MKSASPVLMSIKLDSGDPVKDSDPHALIHRKIALLTDVLNAAWGELAEEIVSGTNDFTSEAGKVNASDLTN